MQSVVFMPCKNPRKAKVKTRLAEKIGSKNAEEIYEENLRSLIEEHSNRDYDLVLALPKKIDRRFFQEIGSLNLLETESASLAEVLKESFSKLLETYEKVIVIASDSIVTNEDVKIALELVAKGKIVISPSLDGGYSLLGMAEAFDCFSNIEMSKGNTFEKTKKIIETHSRECVILPPIPDLDTVEDIPFVFSIIYRNKVLQGLAKRICEYNKRVEFTVVIATFNRPEETLEVVKSISQSFNDFNLKGYPDDLDFEVIICDASKDSATEKLLDEGKFNFVKYQAVVSNGLSYTRDFGITISKREYVVITDSDCIVFKNWLESIYLSIKKNKFPDAIEGAYFYSYYNNWITKSEAAADRKRFYKRKQVDTRNFIIKKSVYSKIGGFDTRYYYSAGAEDLIMRDRLQKIGTDVLFDETIRVYHKYPLTHIGNFRRYAYYGRGSVHVKEYSEKMFRQEFSPWAFWKKSLALSGSILSFPEFSYVILKLLFFTLNYFVGVKHYLIERASNRRFKEGRNPTPKSEMIEKLIKTDQ